ncbi:MAG TPA: sulfatase-like hydrolase/transferase [Candidatus Merdenecus merdavium]|nr:sulfatase-like hydrolase/transferase [Candidatus Merdenecus merdavium]
MLKERPNFIFILTDDQGAWAVESTKNQDIKTPNLKEISKRGITFDEFYCTSPVCSPARASIVTGQIPSCHGIHDWLQRGNMDAYKYPELEVIPDIDFNDRAIDYLENNKTYMEYLAESGYQCALSGKWHLGDNPTPKKEFAYYYTIGRGGCHYYQADTFEDGKPQLSKEYITDSITNQALKYIDVLSEEGAPFYLDVHYTAPHSPWEPVEHPKEFIDMYKDCSFTDTPDLPVHPWQINTCPVGDTPEKRRENLTGYYAAISAMDAGVGKILKKLQAKGLDKNTIIIFTADNGMNMGHHGIWGKGNGTYPPNMYDSSVKVPFIIVTPDCQSPGVVCSAMASQYDIFPTILELAGCRKKQEDHQPGRSLLPQIKNPQKEATERIVVYDEYGKTRMIKKNKFKYIHRYGDGPCEFYDLSKDIDETHNLYQCPEYREQIESMRREMETWFEQHSVPVMDARKYAVTGKGQDKRCHEENAFDQSTEFYYNDKGI